MYISHYQATINALFSLEDIAGILINMCELAEQKEKFILIAFTNFYFIDRIDDKCFAS